MHYSQMAHIRVVLSR